MKDEDVQNQLSSWNERGPESNATLADMEALQEWTAVEIAGNKRRISALEYEVKMLRTILKSKLLIRDNIHAENIRKELDIPEWKYDYLEDLLEAIYDLGEDDCLTANASE